MLFRFGGSGFRVQAWDSGSRGRGLGLRGSPVNLMPAQSTSQLKVKGMIVAHPNRAIRIVMTLSNENNGQESDKRNDKSKNNKRNGDTK